MTQPKAKLTTKLTNADYLALTPPANTGPRYQLINGVLVEMSGASYAHQTFQIWFGSQLLMQSDSLALGQVLSAPFDVHVDLFNTYQPDLLYISNARRGILERLGATGAPDVVVEILSDSTRRRDLNEKLPVYLDAGVSEVWVVDLEARTLAIYSGDSDAPTVVFAATDTLVSEAVPGVAVDLGLLFDRALAAP